MDRRFAIAKQKMAEFQIPEIYVIERDEFLSLSQEMQEKILRLNGIDVEEFIKWYDIPRPSIDNQDAHEEWCFTHWKPRSEWAWMWLTGNFEAEYAKINYEREI